MEQVDLRKDAGTDVLVIYMPVGRAVKLSEMRDYVVESLRKGVLILDHGVAMAVQRIPLLGTGEPAVDVVIKEQELPQKEEDEEKPVPQSGTKVLREHDVSFMGAGGAEKRRIHRRMCAYRTERGLGCWDALIAAVRKKHITVDVLRQLYGGEISASIEDWRAIDKGLDKLGFHLGEKGEADVQNT